MKHLLVVSLLLTATLQAGELNHGLGFAAGQIAGIGFSYRYLPENYGVQVSFGGLSINENNYYVQPTYQFYFDPDKPPPQGPLDRYTYNSRSIHYNIGLMFFKVLHRAKRSRFYVFSGFSFFNQIEKYKEGYYSYRRVDANTFNYGAFGPETERSERSSTRYAGIGIGIEFKVTDNIRLELEWPLTFSSKGDLIMYIPQAGLHYFFK